MKCILIIGKKKGGEIKQNNEEKKRLPLVTLHMCHVTNGGFH
jgi:hypothetical protein